MKVEKMDLSRLQRAGGPPVGWREVPRASYPRPGMMRVDYELHPDPTLDLFTESLDELRSELRKGLDRFRAECAPRVGPQVTCRGEVVSEPVAVPVDPYAHLRHRWHLAAEACKRGFRGIREAFEPVRRSLREAYDGEQ